MTLWLHSANPRTPMWRASHKVILHRHLKRPPMLFRKRPSTQPPTRGTGNTRPRSYRPFVETLEDRLAPVVQSFAGLAFDPAVGGSSHLSPPDTNAAAGPQSIVEVVNNTIAIYTKTGATTASTSLNTFFANNEP